MLLQTIGKTLMDRTMDGEYKEEREKAYNKYLKILGLDHLVENPPTKQELVKPQKETLKESPSNLKETIQPKKIKQTDPEEKKEKPLALKANEKDSKKSIKEKVDVLSENTLSQKTIVSKKKIKDVAPKPSSLLEETERKPQEQKKTAPAKVSEITIEKNDLEDKKELIKANKFAFINWFTQLEINQPPQKLKQEEVLNRFIDKKPKIRPTDNDFPEKPKEYGTEKINREAIVTETLAKLYTQQEKYIEAKKAYEALRLKYPEKSSFFADQIQDLERLMKKKS